MQKATRGSPFLLRPSSDNDLIVRTMAQTPISPAHQDYIARFDGEVRARLEAIARQIAAAFPDAVPVISYQIPAFKAAKVFFFFGAFKTHIGIYPPLSKHTGLIGETAPYRGPKGNLKFPHSEPLPLDFILRIARALYTERIDEI